MIRVRVLAPAFCDYSHLDGTGHMELPEGTTLAGALDRLRLSFLMRRLLAVHVNGSRVPLRTELKDGDTVSVLAGIYGG